MTPTELTKVRRLYDLGFTIRDIQNLTSLSNPEVRAAVGKAPHKNGRPRPRYVQLAEAADELTRQGYDADLIAANFGRQLQT